MFTKQQVLDILKEIDEDKTNTIDFFECLQVCGIKFMTKLRVVYSQFKKDCVVVFKP